jgi:E3 ubiquitin-protein ligase HUWE1
MKLVELKENGALLPVTQENKREFVQLSAQWRLYSSIKDQIEALLGGFYEIIPKDLITIVSVIIVPDVAEILSDGM